MDQEDDRDRETESLDEAMERDTEIRRDTQVRGSLGLPPSGEQPDRDRDEGIPELDDSGNRRKDR